MKAKRSHLKHRGFLGSLDVSLKDNRVRGEVLGLDRTLTFSGRTVDEAKKAFIEALDAHLAASGGDAGPRPYSGHLNVRIHPDAHRIAAVSAAEVGVTMAAWVENAVRNHAAAMHVPRKR